MKAISIDERADGAHAEPRPLRVAGVGVSTSHSCGVRDHAALLAEALGEQGVACSLPWLLRTDGALGPTRSELRAWTRLVQDELDRAELDAVLLHYSVFAYSYKGIPLFVAPTLSALRELRVPIVTVLHEYAYPWGRGGVRGRAWALAQRAILVEVMRASAAVVVTADFRAQWLASRRWLPRRRTVLAPVFSNLPAASVSSREDRADPLIGLFGYAHEGVGIDVVLDALRLLADRGVRVQLILLGGPGRSSAASNAWVDGARARGVTPPSFSGFMSAQDLSNALAQCDVLLSAETAGPTSRKTTLAASLASGSAVVALDGPRRWSTLVQSEAAIVVAPSPSALADALAGLLQDDDRCAALGARGRLFAQQSMGVQHSAEIVARLLEDVVTPA